jgi:sugar diacid utilization regulator
MSSVYKEIKPEWEFYEENSLVMREIIEAVALILSSRISKKEKEKMMKKIEKLAKKVSEKYKKYIIISSPTFYEK